MDGRTRANSTEQSASAQRLHGDCLLRDVNTLISFSAAFPAAAVFVIFEARLICNKSLFFSSLICSWLFDVILNEEHNLSALTRSRTLLPPLPQLLCWRLASGHAPLKSRGQNVGRCIHGSLVGSFSLALTNFQA